MTEVGESTVSGEVRATKTGLRGNLGVGGLVLTVLAFNAPLAVQAGYVPVVVGYGNGLGAPATYAAVGLLLVVFAVGLTAMARYMKSPGAFYSYITAGLGRPPGLGAAFVAFTGYTAINISSYAYAGLIGSDLVHNVFGGPELPWYLFALLNWLIASGFSLLKIDLSAKILGVAMALEIVVITVWNLAIFTDGGPQGIATESFTLSAFSSGSLPLALLFGVLCVTGFEAVAVFREEAHDPIKTIPRATYISVALLAGMYMIGAIALITAYGEGQRCRGRGGRPVRLVHG